MGIEKYQEDFITAHVGQAQETQKKTGIPASVVLAASSLESGWGLSFLSSFYNNFFGIKGAGSAGTAYLTTSEEVDGVLVPQVAGFSAYKSGQDGFDAYGDFLTKNPRYASAGVFATQDPNAVADALQKAGYATDSNYATKLKARIKDFDLTKYDLTPNKTVVIDPTQFPTSPTTVTGAAGVSGSSGMTTIVPDLVGAAGKDVNAAIAGVTSGWLQGGTKIVFIVVLVVVLLVLLLQVLPLPTPANMVKGALKS